MAIEVNHLLAEIALPVPPQRVLTYTIPPLLQKQVEVGKRALVPLGPRLVTGYIVGLLSSEPVSPPGFKPIDAILDSEPLLDHHMLELTRLVADYYLTSWGLVIRAALEGMIRRLGSPAWIQAERAVNRPAAVRTTVRCASPAPRSGWVRQIRASR